MSNLQKPTLFADIPDEEETQFSGGNGCRWRSSRLASPSENSSGLSPGIFSGRRFGFDLNFYLFGLGAAYLFGNPGITKEEVQFVWERSFRFW
ncbi:MAG: hypothetical protein MUC48_22595 [Leptolyngbya sp. Prado105]|jgi:hypothetical protein|nr:hypothetical protein [Leptolyngbya sp. Prado105]